MTTLLAASRQWASRPEDESYPTLAALDDACAGYRATAGEKTVPYRALSAVADGDEVKVLGPTGLPAALTHWAFGQLAARAQAPAGYLRELPAPLAAECVNVGLARRDDDETASLLFQVNGGGPLCRAMLSERYTRIWDADVTRRLVRLEAAGPWQPAPEAAGGKRGLYASDHDLFAFLVDNNRRVFEKDPGGGLARGFFVWNSEVGATTFGITRFLYSFMCSNHMVWGASKTSELRIRHVGTADARAWGELVGELRKYDDASVSDDEAIITRARTMVLGKDKDAVLDRVFGLRQPMLSRQRIDAAYTLAATKEDTYGQPGTVWSLASGLTELSQRIPFADERTAVDRAAGKVLELAF